MSIVRRLAALSIPTLAAVLCLGISGPGSTQGNGTQHFSDSFSVTFFDDCSGELVDIDVTFKSDAHVVTNKKGFHVDFHDVYSARGAGQSSGVVYIANQTDSFSLNLAKGVTETSPIHFEMVSKGGSDNLEFHGLFHLTANANGVLTCFVDRLSISCKG